MNTHALPAWPGNTAAGRRSSYGTALLLLFGSVATATIAVASNGSLLIVLGAFAVVVGVWLICVNPIRYTLFALFFLSLALDSTGEGLWASPVAPLGALLGIQSQ